MVNGVLKVEEVEEEDDVELVGDSGSSTGGGGECNHVYGKAQ